MSELHNSEEEAYDSLFNEKNYLERDTATGIIKYKLDEYYDNLNNVLKTKNRKNYQERNIFIESIKRKVKECKEALDRLIRVQDELTYMETGLYDAVMK